MKKLRIDLAAVLVLVAGTATASTVWHYASCYKNADGSGACQGTFQGFRDQTYAKSYVEFEQSSDGSRLFRAALTNGDANGVSAWCIPDATVAPMWPQAMAHNGSFYIHFTAGGVCDQLRLVNGSPYFH